MSQGFDHKSAAAHQSFRTQKKPTEVTDIRCIQQSLVQHFQGIKYPRVERTKKHQLTDILVIAILAVIAGSQGWEDMENYGISKQPWLAEFLQGKSISIRLDTKDEKNLKSCQEKPN